MQELWREYVKSTPSCTTCDMLTSIQWDTSLATVHPGSQIFAATVAKKGIAPKNARRSVSSSAATAMVKDILRESVRSRRTCPACSAATATRWVTPAETARSPPTGLVLSVPIAMRKAIRTSAARSLPVGMTLMLVVMEVGKAILARPPVEAVVVAIGVPLRRRLRLPAEVGRLLPSGQRWCDGVKEQMVLYMLVLLIFGQCLLWQARWQTDSCCV